MIGNVVLFGWPLVMVILFARLDKPLAITLSLLLGFLFLPETLETDLPILPALNKDTIPAMVGLLLVLLFAERNRNTVLSGWMPKLAVPRFLIYVLLFSAFLTVLTNRDLVIHGPVVFQALRPYDGFSVILGLLTGLIPFFLARKYFAHPDQHRMLLKVFLLTGFMYSFLALFEVRMSPQLNNMVYGFFPHSFEQHIRGGGFRPLVFLEHGLILAMVFAIMILGAISLARASVGGERLKYFAIAAWLLMTLTLSNSLGALAITIVFLPIVIFLKPRMQLLFCAVIAMIVLTYPALRGAHLIPLDAIQAWADGVSAERGHSLAFRTNAEELLLARAQERPLFGWGGFGRSFVFDDQGRPLTVPDGYWVIVVGMGGWVRYLAEFGLLTIPAVIAARAFHQLKFGFETTGLIIMLVANLVDLLPNSSITPLTWLVAGAVWGRIELGKLSETADEKPLQPTGRTGPVYTRFDKKTRPGARPAGNAYARSHTT